MQLLLVELI